MRIPDWILWTFVVVACIGGFFVAAGIEPIIDSTATVGSARARVWVHEPFAGPGEHTWWSVESSGRLTGVAVRNGETVLTEWHGSETDFAWIPVELPEQTGELQLTADIRWRRDTRIPTLSFLDNSNEVRLTVPVTVRPLLARLAWRVGAIGLALAFLLQGIVGMSKLIAWGKALDDDGDRNLSEAVGGALCVVAVVYALGGYWAFVLPMTAGTQWVGTLPAVIWFVVWLIGAPYAAWKTRQWLDREAAHRLHIETPRDAETLVRALESRGLQARRVLAWLRVTDGEHTLWIALRDLRSEGRVRVYRSGEMLALKIAHALAEQGPVMLFSYGLLLPVEADRTLESIEAELFEARRRQAEAMLEHLERMGDFMKGIMDRLDV